MNGEQLQIIDVFDDEYNGNFISNYIPLIRLHNSKQKEAVEKYIYAEAHKFLEKILEPDIIATPIAYPKLITEKDFKEIDISYFYDNFFFDLGERDDRRKLKLKVKWGITFDERCAPIQIKYLPNNSNELLGNITSNDSNIVPNRRFGTIDINGTPIFYYIYFTIQEILDVIRQLPFTENTVSPSIQHHV
ncbi:unknown protein (plasmid) [Nostoc sp. NIES-3756]|uniref:hypothetical protein n=1 Tax=Nostoc sp. NIES-3756 TaxID=1751286 RepID=UPI00071EC57F|nr:hypothetical protein [Nostoc sp. NIES-3756]BAT57014.1 unknown protein [Nostoc sp. NIES-3756]